MKTGLDLKNIHPHGGDRRGAFEELSFQLFARHSARNGPAIRRHGAGGDAGLEAFILDSEARVSAGLQSKFFVDNLGATQWKDLDESIIRALVDNASDGALEEIIVALPRNLTANQFNKWKNLCEKWAAEAARLNYLQAVSFTLWDESRLRGFLLEPGSRGLLLHYFEIPDFNTTHCRQRSAATIAGLGDRYLPDLHTSTTAEDKLHVFLRSERCRQSFLEAGRDCFHSHEWPRKRTIDLPETLKGAFDGADTAWQRVLPLLGDGISLPPSFTRLSSALKETVEALGPPMQRISALIPPRPPRSEDDYYLPAQSRSPLEEMLNGLGNWKSDLRSFARYLDESALADQPRLLLTGGPGTGKTHVLAEVCSRYGDQGGIVLFVEGAKFSTDDPPWTQFMRWAGFKVGNPRDLIEALSAMAADTSLPALICIDALNETPNRELWRNSIIDFAAEVRTEDRVKLIVSCRSDYLDQTLPEALRKGSAAGWAVAENEGLGIEVFEAFPKFMAAYDVRWHGLPPLVEEFRNPLFLRIFCEAYAGRTPDVGSLSLGAILRQYAQRKAEMLGGRIDCDASRVLDALRDLAARIQAAHNLLISEREARTVCERHHAPTESSRSLYRALLSEGILTELPGPVDALGPTQLARFTYERVWDYFLSLGVLPNGGEVSAVLVSKLRDPNWRWENSGLITMLYVRFPEEGHGELCDFIAPDGNFEPDELEHFLESIPWRTKETVSDRTLELFEKATEGGTIETVLEHVVPIAPNPLHPWNADWLDVRLAALPLAERDRTWTIWVNEQLFHFDEDSPVGQLLIWAERARLDMLADEHRRLLATVLSWCASTTVIEGRKRLAAAITRLLAGYTHIAVKLVARFLQIDDPYIREWVLLAAAGAAQHASTGDVHLTELASLVHSGVFSGKTVDSNILIRHYAAEICRQAAAKGMLASGIAVESFEPPFRSRWPRIWSETKCNEKEEETERAHTFFQSIVPNCDGARYGAWGRYVMQSRVSQFLPQKLSEGVTPTREGYQPRFDARIARRYIVQRVFEIGWDPQSPDCVPEAGYEGGRRPRVERLSKKYQWIALHEFLGLLSDHYRFHDYDDPGATFKSAHQLVESDLLDPFVIEPPPPDRVQITWNFTQSPVPWWRGRLNPLPQPLSVAQQLETASGRRTFHPAVLLAINDGQYDWLALSAVHEWDEPQPFWTSGSKPPHVEIQTAIQSYLVDPSKRVRLLRELSVRAFLHDSSLWLDEPGFDQAMATLRTFPLHQEDLRLRCELDEQYATQFWRTGACSTTCRCAPDEEQRRAPDGSMPSPQLAQIGNLRWLGRAFDFAPPQVSSPLVCYMGKGYRGACIVRLEALLRWLDYSKKCLVWRCYIEKSLYHESSRQNHTRAYWSTFFLRPDGRIAHFGGATCTFSHGPDPEEALPWTE